MIDSIGFAIGFGAFLGIPCLAVALGSVAKRWLELRERQAILASGAEVEVRACQSEVIGALRDRVAVLERIATDPAHRLADEIDRFEPA